MPTWPDAAAFARDLEKMQRDMERQAGARIALEAAKAARPIAYRTAAGDLGGDPKFSGWRPWLELQVKAGRAGAPSATVLPTRNSAGPWTVANIGRNATGAGGGFQGPGVNSRTGSTNLRFRKDGGVSIRRRKARRWNGVTRGFGTADRASVDMERGTESLIERQFKVELGKRFTVS